MRRSLAGLTISAAIALGAAALAQSPGSSSFNSQRAGRFLSASVYGSWHTHREPSGDTMLDLLVLWRGTPGWWQEGNSREGRTGGAGPHVEETARVGNRQLRIAFDRPVRSARIQDVDVPLNGANVVLVDDVDAVPPRFTTMTVDPKLPDGLSIATAVRQSPALQAFLRCEEKVTDPVAERYVELVCAQMTGK